MIAVENLVGVARAIGDTSDRDSTTQPTRTTTAMMPTTESRTT